MKAKDNPFSEKKTLRLGDSLYDLSHPAVVAPLYLHPDLGVHDSLQLRLVQTARQLLKDGASVLELVAYLDHKGRARIAPETEVRQVELALRLLKQEGLLIHATVNTMRSSVARAGMQAGAEVVRDPSGGTADPDMLDVVAETKAAFVCGYLHRAGQKDMPPVADLMTYMLEYFSQRLEACVQRSVNDFVIDPGFGQGKSTQENIELLSRLHFLRPLGQIVLTDFSQRVAKAHVLSGQLENQHGAEEALVARALQEGVGMVKVSNVAAAANVIRVHQAIVA